MNASRRPFRSLRSFTHAARPHPAPSEILSDPIVDDAYPPTPIKSYDFQFSPQHPKSNFLHVPSSTDPPIFNLAPQENSPSLLSEPPSASPIHKQCFPPITHPKEQPQAHREAHPPRATIKPLQPSPPIALGHVGDDRPVRNKLQRVFNLEHDVEPQESPAIKRRRTRSSIRRKRTSSPSPEVDELLFRQLVDNATDEERKAILAASGSSRGRRKLRQLFEREDHHHAQRGEVTPTNPNPLRDGDVEWLGTSYDSVEEVAPTPSPPTKRKARRARLTRAESADRVPRQARDTAVERIDTSESPERIMRRRSRRLNHDIHQAPVRASSERTIETVDSSSSPGPKRRRSRRLARGAQLPSKGIPDSDNSDKSGTSGESEVERSAVSKKSKRRNGVSRSRPLPRPKAGLLRERLRRRTPLLPPKKKTSGRGKKKATASIGDTTDQDSSAPRRSKRLRNARAPGPSVFDVDADDEVIEEGSADDENHDGSCFEEEELTAEEVQDDEDEEDGEIELDVHDDDDGDDDDEEDEEDFEERAWKEQLRRKQIRRKRKRNGRRKRTQPRDAFRTEGEFLTARQQRERLDFLVKQSAEIASHLHNAMGEASKRSLITPNGPKNQSTEPTIDAGKRAKKEEPGNKVAAEHTNHDSDREPLGESEATGKEETFVPPSGSDCELQPHQREGVDWLLTLDGQGLNAILADEMGLGKTIQAVSFLASLVISGSRGPHLVVAPKNVCQHWADEVRKWYPKELTVVTHLGNSDDRLERLRSVLEEDNFDILVTSFDHALRDLFTRKRRDGISWEHLQVLRAFRKVEFEYLVVDEAHRLKNDSSKINQGIRSYDLAQRRILLTGTPLSNNLRELWSLMNVLNPRIFSSKATFEAWFSAPFASKTKKQSKVSLTHAEHAVIVDRLHTVIRPFFRRRVRADVCPSFTSADEVVVRCPLTGLQRAVSLHLQRRARADEAGIANVIMAMRAASNHPYIVSEALFDSGQSHASERLVASSGKFVFLHFALPRLISSGHRVLIFSQFKRVLDFIEDLLIMLGLKFGRLDGETSSEDRINGLIDFNREGSDTPIFLLTTRAGGIGLNLQTADTVILFDSDWNPSADLQAVSRIQRIGQKRTVHIMRLVTEKSVDELIVETARHKLRTQNVAVGAGKFNTSLGAALDAQSRRKDLEELLKRLEAQSYPEDEEVKGRTASQENGSPESLSPRRVSRAAQNRRFAEWGNQLLRKGESALSSVDITPIWVDNPANSSDSCIPHWLTIDADLQSAAKALRCTDASSAERVYKENLLLKTEAGMLSKKDRATRARRQLAVVDISDADSENDTERSDDVDWPVISVSESESDDLPEDETVPEMQRTEKKGTFKGLLKEWSGKQVTVVPARATGNVTAAAATIGASQACRPSISLHPTVGDDPAQVPSKRTPYKKGELHIDPVGGGKPAPDLTSIWGLPFPHATSPSMWVETGATRKRVALPTAHLKRLPPTKHSGTQRTGSQARKKQRSPREANSRVSDKASHGAIQKERQPVHMAPHSQQDLLRDGSLLMGNAPPGVFPTVVRRSCGDKVTKLSSKPVQQTCFAAAVVHPPHIGVPGEGTRQAVPVFGQHSVTMTAPAVSQGGLHAVPAWDCRPSSHYLHTQEKGLERPSLSGVVPTSVKTAKPITASAPAKRSSSDKSEARRTIAVKAGEVGIASVDLCEEWPPEKHGTATEETVSVRPVTSKRDRARTSNCGKVVDAATPTQRSSVRRVDAQNERMTSKPTSDSSVSNIGTTALPSAKPISADEFGTRVERLKQMTKVVDTQFLEDALLDCDCDIESAKEMVLRQIR